MLVKIESEAENEFIETKYLANGKFWIGLTDAEKEGDWKWADGTTVIGYANWNTGESSNALGEEYCARMNSKGKWGDFTCSFKVEFICEK